MAIRNAPPEPRFPALSDVELVALLDSGSLHAGWLPAIAGEVVLRGLDGSWLRGGPPMREGAGPADSPGTAHEAHVALLRLIAAGAGHRGDAALIARFADAFEREHRSGRHAVPGRRAGRADPDQA